MFCSLGGVIVSLGEIGFSPGHCRQAAVHYSVCVNYGRSRMSHMLAELLVQFSVFHFCFQEKKKEVKKKKKKKKAFCQASSCP
jgi:hypothetical protein